MNAAMLALGGANVGLLPLAVMDSKATASRRRESKFNPYERTYPPYGNYDKIPPYERHEAIDDAEVGITLKLLGVAAMLGLIILVGSFV